MKDEKKFTKPPKWANRFVEWYCISTYQDEVIGDLQELYERKIEAEGLKKAQLWYCLNALLFMRLYNLKLFQKSIKRLTPNVMWKNYLTLTYRHMRKNAPYLAINVLGVALALALGIFAYVMVEYNMEFNQYFEHTENIYRIDVYRDSEMGDYEIRSDQSPINIGAKAKDEIAGVQDYVRHIIHDDIFSNGVDVFHEGITYTDPLFLDYFNFELIEGDKSTFKRDPLAVYISKDIATKYFGEKNAVGETVYINYQINNKDSNEDEIERLALKVAGVFKAPPKNNSFLLNILVNIEHFIDLKKVDENDINSWARPVTFIRVDQGTAEQSVEKELEKLISVFKASNNPWKIKDIYLTSFENIGSESYHYNELGLRNYHMNDEPIYIFVVIAILIILVACFNFTNTGMTLAQKRVREIGVRKALGGVRSQIIFQFLLENFLTSIISLALSLYFADLLMQWIASADAPFELVIEGNYSLFAFLVGILLLVSILAGIYPAMYVGGMNASPILKGNYRLKGASTFTKVLLALQFTVSFIAVFGSIVMYQNTVFQNNLDIGYDYEKLLYAIPPNNKVEAFAQDVKQMHLVEDVTISPGHFRPWVNSKYIDHKDRKLQADFIRVTPDYLKMLGIDLLSGNMPKISAKDTLEEKILINQALAEKLNLKEPIGEVIEVDSASKYVVGVIPNIVTQGFSHGSDEVDRLMYVQLTAQQSGYVVVKAKPENLLIIEDEMMSLWKKHEPYMAYEGGIQKEVLEETKTISRVFGELFLFLATLTILLSASGLFALMSLTIDSKIKEIGIRKVMGANLEQIVMVINKPYLWVVLIAWLFGTLTGYYVSVEVFLPRFRYYIEPDALPFIISLLIILVIAIFTMGGKVLSAATANPTDTLKSE